MDLYKRQIKITALKLHEGANQMHDLDSVYYVNIRNKAHDSNTTIKIGRNGRSKFRGPASCVSYIYDGCTRPLRCYRLCQQPQIGDVAMYCNIVIYK